MALLIPGVGIVDNSTTLLIPGTGIVAAEPATGQTIVVGLVSETDSAFAVTAYKDLAAGLVSETDSALAIGRSKTYVVGLVVETDSGLALVALSGDLPANPWYEGRTIVVLSDVTGLIEWVDYLPVSAAASNPGRYDPDGAFPVVQARNDAGGAVAWVDYIPVYVVSRTIPWSTEADGYIPFEDVTP